MIALERGVLARELGASVLIVGARGMLARALAETLGSLGIEFAAWGRDRLDITDPGAVARLVAAGPWTTVFNAAAWTNVDGAEANEPAATRVNADAVGFLRDACARASTTLVNFGTDYVFPGSSPRPCRVNDPTGPINAYGRSKLAGERLLEGARGVLHVRTSWLYAPWGTNFVLTIARALAEKPSLRVVNDQRGRPTSAEHLARVTLALIQRGARGFFHAADEGECSWFEFARQIASCLGSKTPIEPCTTADFPRPARRPAYSVLDLSATIDLVGPLSDWNANLAGVIDRSRA